MTEVHSYLANGVWVLKDKNESIVVPIINPWNGEVVFEYTEPTSHEVAVAVSAAKAALDVPFSPRQRAAVLLKTSLLMEERHEQLARTLCLETGKPIKDARLEVHRATLNVRMASEEAARIQGYTEEQEPIGTQRVVSMTIREPIGVVCAITPFNFPFNISALKIAPALAAGNAVVVKPADQTPLCVSLLADLLIEAGLPQGYISVVLGGARVGQDLFNNPNIDLYTFTGSVKVGEILKQQTGLRPIILELGSNAPNIVHHDANLPLAVGALVKAAFSFAGQVCVSAQRIYVHEDIYDTFLHSFLKKVNSLKIGDPFVEDTDLGPLISEQAAIRVQDWVQEAVQQGAILHTNLQRTNNMLQPIVLSQVTNAMKVMCEEVFGPVVNVVPYHSVAQVIAMCNDSQFGLQAGVFTNNLDVALSLAHGLAYGSVNINQSSTARPDSMPYGGLKQSGIGKEGARASIETMTTQKVITIVHQGVDSIAK